MAWNLPEDQQKPKTKSDPWTGRPTDGKKPSGQQPPNIEALLRDGWLKVQRYWRKPRPFNPRATSQWVTGLVVVVWLGLGIQHVSENQLAYVMRLGVYQGQLAMGWQWRAWGLYQVHFIAEPLSINIAAEVMTQDLNLAKVSMGFRYRIDDPKAYLFHMQAPEATLQALATSALQQTVGHEQLAVLLSEKNPAVVVNQLKSLLQASFDQAGLGVNVETVTIDNVAIPDTLQELFNKMDALYTTQATEKQKNVEYQQRVLPPAVQKAQAWLTAANTYSQQALVKAQADVADFLSLLPSYEKAPKLIKYQLYTQNMTTLLSQAATVIVDAKGPAPMIVMNEAGAKKTLDAVNPTVPLVTESDAPAADNNDSYGNIKGGYDS